VGNGEEQPDPGLGPDHGRDLDRRSDGWRFPGYHDAAAGSERGPGRDIAAQREPHDDFEKPLPLDLLSATVQAADRDDWLADADISVRRNPGDGCSALLMLVCIVVAIVFFALGNNRVGTILLSAPVFFLGASVFISLVSILKTAMGKLRPRDRPGD